MESSLGKKYSFQMLYETLKYWSSHHNKDMLHAGTHAMEALLAQVGKGGGRCRE